MLQRLTSEDLYLLDDLVEFASLLVREGLGCGEGKGHMDPKSSSDTSRMMELANLASNSCPVGHCLGKQTKKQVLRHSS